MKLVSNKPYDSLFVYFPGIDDIEGWTEQNPAVYHEICGHDDGDYVELRLSNYSQAPKYFVFRARGGVDHVMHSVGETRARVSLYDWLEYSSTDLASGSNALIDGTIGGEDSIYIREETPITFLARVVPVQNDYYSIDRTLRISFSNPPEPFDISPHFIRDWRNRIDGTCWNVAGKVRDCMRLSDIGRRSMPTMNVLEAWRHGVYAKAVEWNDMMGGTDGLKSIFEGDENFVSYGTHRNISFTYEDNAHYYDDGQTVQVKPFGLDGTPMAVRMETLLYSASRRRASFQFSGNGEFHAEVADSSMYKGFSQSSNAYLYDVQLEKGYNRVSIWYNSPKDGSKPRMSMLVDTGYGYYQYIQPNVLFLPNLFDLDESMPFEKVFEGAIVRMMYEDNYIGVPSNSDIPIDVGETPHGFTIGMMLRFPDAYNGLHGVMHGRGIRISRWEENLLRVERDGLQAPLDFQIVPGRWHSLFLMMDDTMVSWYWDLETNGIENWNVHALSSTDRLHLGYDGSFMDSPDTRGRMSYGTFDVMNIVVSDKIFRQGEINRIYQNRMTPQ